MSTATEWKVREILFTLSRMFDVSASAILHNGTGQAMDARALAIWAMWQVGMRDELRRPMGGNRGFRAEFILASLTAAEQMMEDSPRLKQEMETLVARARLIRDAA